MSGLVSGLVGGLLGWRVIFGLAAVVTVGFAVVLHRRIPRLAPKTGDGYGRLPARCCTSCTPSARCNILGMNRIFLLSAEARSRRNTAMITGNFFGGALGSLGASLLWEAARWPAVAVAGGLLSVLALGIWALTRRGALVVR